MLKFTAVQNGKEIKKFEAATIETIYRRYNVYCKRRGFDRIVETNDSFGHLAWSNGQDKIFLKRVVK